jgi:hypothetical protein
MITQCGLPSQHRYLNSALFESPSRFLTRMSPASLAGCWPALSPTSDPNQLPFP